MNDRQRNPAKTADLGDVRLDLDRRRRCGFPEVVFGESKDVAMLKRVIERLLNEGEPALITRLTVDKGAELAAAFPAGRYNAVGRTFRVTRNSGSAGPAEPTGHVAIVTAGTSDMPVAEEVRETVEWMGVGCELIVDVGVAGPQRLQEVLPRIAGSDAVVVVAGMEGALASVVGGHVDCPVIAVPTSVGYGASFGGIAALLGMLNSCAANVSVYIAALLASRRARGGVGERGRRGDGERQRDGGTERQRDGSGSESKIPNPKSQI
jgi:NCAIR mutase (PurE)-related protein